jgi:microcystin-dependent protein
MSNPYFSATGNPGNQTRGVSALVRYEFQLIQAAFDAVYAQAFSPALPGQSGNAGKFIKTDGANATWVSVGWSDVTGKPSTLVADGGITTVMFAGGAKAPFAGSADTASNSGTATNLAGGDIGYLPYQSGPGMTALLAPGTAGQVLRSGGVGAPSWVTIITQQPGEICFFAATTAPTGFVKAAGQLLSRTTYAALWAHAQASGNLAASDGAWVEGQYSPGDGSTTFRVPDMRENFPRGWADDRTGGLDDGRGIGTLQLDQFQGHAMSGAYNGFDTRQGGAGGTPNLRSDGATQNTTGIVSDGTNGTPRVGTETRPRNVALLACIKI